VRRQELGVLELAQLLQATLKLQVRSGSASREGPPGPAAATGPPGGGGHPAASGAPPAPPPVVLLQEAPPPALPGPQLLPSAGPSPAGGCARQACQARHSPRPT
jgi:hypothetical protein